MLMISSVKIEGTKATVKLNNNPLYVGIAEDKTVLESLHNAVCEAARRAGKVVPISLQKWSTEERDDGWIAWAPFSHEDFSELKMSRDPALSETEAVARAILECLEHINKSDRIAQDTLAIDQSFYFFGFFMRSERRARGTNRIRMLAAAEPY